MPGTDIAERLATLEHHANSNFFEIQRRLDELLKFQDRAKMNFLEVEKKIIALEQALGEKKPAAAPPAEELSSLESRLMDKIKSLEDIMMLLELEVVKAKERAPAVAVPELEVTPKIPSAFEDRLKALEEKFSALEKLKLKVPVELVQHEPRLKAIEDNVLLLQRKLSEEASRLESLIAAKAVTEPSAQRFIQKMREEMDELRRDLEKAELLKHELLSKEKSFATKPDLEAFEARIRSELGHIHDLTDRIAAAERSVDSKLVDIEERIRDEIARHTKAAAALEQKFKAEVESHRRAFDSKVADLEAAIRNDLEVHRRAFDSKVVDMEERVAKIAAEIAQSEIKRIAPMTAERGEALINRVNTIERELESRATAVVSKEIAAFAEAIDKKFPDLMTKADFAQWSKAVAQRVQTIEAPDIRPLMERMDKFELRLNELASLIREVATRMPIVVE
ncbi:MAG: hypothetical protein QW548_02200 [Candidatus Aenigmatarchaeota archaeon]